MTTKKTNQFHQGMRVMINGEPIDLDKPLPPKAHLIATFSDDLDKPAKAPQYKVQVLVIKYKVQVFCPFAFWTSENFSTLNEAYQYAEPWDRMGNVTRVVEVEE